MWWTRRHVFVIALLFGLPACAASPTPYQPVNDEGGYTEQQLDDTTWRVQFTGNADTPRQTVENYILYRSAEITLAGGYEKFAVINQEVERTVRYRGYGGSPFTGPAWPYWRARPYRYPYWAGYSSPTDFRPIDNYAAYATIRPFTGSSPVQDAVAYDAREVIKNLAPTVTLPQPTDG